MRPFARLAACASLLAAGTACSSAADDPGRATADSLAAVRADSALRARQDAANRAQPGYIVDSILPIEEEVRRFRAAVGGAPATSLQQGAPSLDDLVQSFAAAVAARDTARLRTLALAPREFIDLVYPSSPFTKPPLRQAPALVWANIQHPSGSGLRRALARLGGRPLRIRVVTCADRPERQGGNLLHANCEATFASGDGADQRGQLFGTILERDGRFKFISYANMF
ncbi:MAG: hypothetical protein FJ363_09035 [Gemmatimonadetes bacterium]|nr:hypothetical protein [Gemmatimonadota bacterium]